jgi:hypothetical protein
VPKSSSERPKPCSRRRFEDGDRPLAVDHQQRLGQFQHDLPRRDAGARTMPSQPVDDVLLQEARAGQVDRQASGSRPASAHCAQVTCGGGKHPVAERDDQSRFLGQRNEVQRPEQAAPRVLPAHQGLGADQRPLPASTFGWKCSRSPRPRRWLPQVAFSSWSLALAAAFISSQRSGRSTARPPWRRTPPARRGAIGFDRIAVARKDGDAAALAVSTSSRPATDSGCATACSRRSAIERCVAPAPLRVDQQQRKRVAVDPRHRLGGPHRWFQVLRSTAADEALQPFGEPHSRPSPLASPSASLKLLK